MVQTCGVNVWCDFWCEVLNTRINAYSMCIKNVFAISIRIHVWEGLRAFEYIVFSCISCVLDAFAMRTPNTQSILN